MSKLLEYAAITTKALKVQKRFSIPRSILIQ